MGGAVGGFGRHEIEDCIPCRCGRSGGCLCIHPVQQPERVVQEVNRGPLPGSVEQFQQVAGDRVYFGYDRYNLDMETRQTLQRQAAWLQSYPGVNVIVEGHADERGTREYNLALGARRANEVKEFLINEGVREDRIKTVSFGKERPIAAESNERAWALNRNAHTRITSGAADS